MDAGIADTINRRDVTLIFARLDALDLPQYNLFVNTCPCVHCAPYRAAVHGNGCTGYHCHGGCVYLGERPWYEAPMADTLMKDDDASRPDRAWLFGALAQSCPGIAFDGAPAEGDWENLFGHIRAAIQARRDGTHLAHVAEIPVQDGVGSR